MMKMRGMPEYSEYTQSGHDWIGPTPSHWMIKRLQDVASCNDDTVDESAKRDANIKYVDISAVSSDTNTYGFEVQALRDAPSRARRLVKSGDTIFSTVRPYLKAVATIQNPDPELVVSTGFAVARPRRGNDSAFLGYALRNEVFISEVSANSVGASYPAINASDLFKLKIPLPPAGEQRAIAQFLDDKCSKINAAVRVKEYQITLLRERRQIIIQDAVTRGLNPAAPMKDSGIDWIGQIPAHWENMPNKYLFKMKKDTVGKRSDQYDLLSLTLRGIIKRDMENPEGKFPAEFDTYQEVCPGYFVFCHFDVEETPRTVGLSEFFGMITGAYTVYSVANGVDPRFLLHFYIFADTDKKMRSMYKGLRNTIPKDAFGAFKTPLPPIEEQQAIVAHIDDASRKIEDGIAIKQDQIATLKEYKTSLINAAVTGKIKVI
jgi:type I restriction enzyme S subunit